MMYLIRLVCPPLFYRWMVSNAAFQEKKLIQRLFNSGSTIYQPRAQLQIVAQEKRITAMTILHHTMMVLGVAAITVLALMFIRPELTDRFQASSPFFNADADTDEPEATTQASSEHATTQATLNGVDLEFLLQPKFQYKTLNLDQ